MKIEERLRGVRVHDPRHAVVLMEAAECLAEMRAALEAVEEWWLREGLRTEFGRQGAPQCIFAARAALERARREG